MSLRVSPPPSLHPRLSPHYCVFSQEGKREQRSKKGRRFKASNGVPGVSIGLPATKSEFLLWKLLLGTFVQLAYRNLLPSLCFLGFPRHTLLPSRAPPTPAFPDATEQSYCGTSATPPSPAKRNDLPNMGSHHALRFHVASATANSSYCLSMHGTTKQ